MATGFVTKKGENYYIVYPHPLTKKPKWRAAGKNKKNAERMLAEVMNEIHSGVYRDPKEISFTEFALKFLKDYAQGQVKPSTLQSYEGYIKNHLIPYFGQVKLMQIGADFVQGLVSSKVEEKKLSPKTISNMVTLLKEMFKYAVIWGYLKENPATYVKKPRIERCEMNFLTPQEMRLFLNNVNPKYYSLFLTACLTGLRRGELLGLKWDDIDWNSHTIFVRRALYKGRFITPKSKNSIRRVNMPPTLRDVLFEHKINAPASDRDLVFTTSKGTPLDPDVLVRREFLPALRRAGLRRIRFHDLRHSYAAMLIHQGENIKYIQNQLGHASAQTTLDRYGHLLPEVHNHASLKLEKQIFGNFDRKIIEIGQKRSF
ncbi:MAG: site-specific integrase [Actinomycetota bacterium]